MLSEIFMQVNRILTISYAMLKLGGGPVIMPHQSPCIYCPTLVVILSNQFAITQK